MKPEEAIDIVAKQILASAALDIEWESYPDIGEFDWLAIEQRCSELAPEQDKFDEAITLIEGRTDHEYLA